MGKFEQLGLVDSELRVNIGDSYGKVGNEDAPLPASSRKRLISALVTVALTYDTYFIYTVQELFGLHDCHSLTKISNVYSEN